jgi:hypothetical protein
LLPKVICVSGESHDKFVYFETATPISAACNQAAPMTIELGGVMKSLKRVNLVSRLGHVIRFRLVWAKN